MQVDLEAAKLGIVGLSREQMPPVMATIKRSWVTMVALCILVYTLFIARMSAGTAATISGLLCLPLFAVLSENRKTYFKRLIKALEESGRMLLIVGGVMAAAGIVVGAFNISGMSFSISYLLAEAGKSHVMFLLIGAAVASMILGMGMPSAAAYALVAILIAPALVKFGIIPMAAHLFIFYFAIISNITPPVALSCFAAAPLAGADPMKIGWSAMRLALMIYVIPFIFVFSPALIMKGSFMNILLTFVVTGLGVWFFTIGVAGYFFQRISFLRRVFLMIGGGALFLPLELDSSVLVILNALGLLISLAAFLPEIRIIGRRWGLIKTSIDPNANG
jgi:TRAP transporter 4TM/12TM fusion protein